MILSPANKSLLTHKKVIVYGPPKSGKTRLVARLAERYKLKWLDLERGIETALDPANLDPKYLSNIDCLQVADAPDHPIGVQAALEIASRQPVKLCDAHGTKNCVVCKANPAASYTEFNLFGQPADTIFVMDSATQFTTSAINYINQGRPPDYKMVTDDWGQLAKIQARFYSYLQAAPANIVVITHESMTTQEDGKNKLTPLSGSANFSAGVAKYFGHVVYCSMLGKNFQSQSVAGSVVNAITGSRSNVDTNTKESISNPLLGIFS